MWPIILDKNHFFSVNDIEVFTTEITVEDFRLKPGKKKINKSEINN